MLKIIKASGTGKTVLLLNHSATTGEYIITANERTKSNLKHQAQKLGLDIPEPVTVHEYFSSGKLKGSYIKSVCIDDADTILQQVFDTVDISMLTMRG